MTAAKVRAGLSKADEKFEVRREIIELLDVKAKCNVEDGQKVLFVECRVNTTIKLVQYFWQNLAGRTG